MPASPLTPDTFPDWNFRSGGVRANTDKRRPAPTRIGHDDVEAEDFVFHLKRNLVVERSFIGAAIDRRLADDRQHRLFDDAVFHLEGTNGEADDRIVPLRQTPALRQQIPDRRERTPR